MKEVHKKKKQTHAQCSLTARAGFLIYKFKVFSRNKTKIFKKL